MLKSIIILLSIAVCFDYEIWQIDVKRAFLNDYLDEDILCLNQIDSYRRAKKIRYAVAQVNLWT